MPGVDAVITSMVAGFASKMVVMGANWVWVKIPRTLTPTDKAILKAYRAGFRSLEREVGKAKSPAELKLIASEFAILLIQPDISEALLMSALGRKSSPDIQMLSRRFGQPTSQGQPYTGQWREVSEAEFERTIKAFESGLKEGLAAEARKTKSPIANLFSTDSLQAIKDDLSKLVRRDSAEQYLEKAAMKYERDQLELLRQEPPEIPYKYLLPFSEKDSSIFFGRAKALDELFQKVKQGKVSVLHGPSGAGKTSLLRAGLLPKLINISKLPVYVDMLNGTHDPLTSVKQAVLKSPPASWPSGVEKGSLCDFLREVLNNVKSEELVLLLDQFESFLRRNATVLDSHPFVDSLSECLKDSNLNIRVVIAVRDDSSFSMLSKVGERIDGIFASEYRLEQMSPAEMCQAITDPLAKIEVELEYDKELLDTLVNDFYTTQIALSDRHETSLPYLQLVCSRLYEERQGNRLSLETYDRIGRADGVLRRYLRQQLGQFGDKEDQALALMGALIDSSGMRKALSLDDLVQETMGVKKVIEHVLMMLDKRRLIQTSAEGNKTVYVITHEILGREIKRLLDPKTKKLKEVQELFDSEVHYYRVHRSFIPSSRLDLLFPFRKQLRTTEESLLYLMMSAIREKHYLHEWLSLNSSMVAKAFENILAMQPIGRASLIWRCHLLRDFGKFDDSIALLQTFVDRFQEDREALNDLAYICRLAGKHAQSLVVLEKSLNVGSSQSWVIKEQGIAYIALGEFEIGLEKLNRSAKLNPRRDVEFFQGLVLLVLGEERDAYLKFEKGREMQRRAVDAEGRMTVVGKLRTAKYSIFEYGQQALDLYREAISESPPLDMMQEAASQLRIAANTLPSNLSVNQAKDLLDGYIFRTIAHMALSPDVIELLRNDDLRVSTYV